MKIQRLTFENNAESTGLGEARTVLVPELVDPALMTTGLDYIPESVLLAWVLNMPDHPADEEDVTEEGLGAFGSVTGLQTLGPDTFLDVVQVLVKSAGCEVGLGDMVAFLLKGVLSCDPSLRVESLLHFIESIVDGLALLPGLLLEALVVAVHLGAGPHALVLTDEPDDVEGCVQPRGPDQLAGGVNADAAGGAAQRNSARGRQSH